MVTENDKDKILSLFYSEDLANHLIALEIIKNSSYPMNSFIPAMVYIVLSSKDKTHAKLFFDFIQTKLTTLQLIFLKSTLDKSYVNLSPIHYIGHTIKPIQSYLGPVLTAAVFYVLYKKTKDKKQQLEHISIFLALDQGEHFARNEVFTHLLSQLNKTEDLLRHEIPSLFTKELNLYLETFYAKTKRGNKTSSLRFNNPKNPDALTCLSNKRCHIIHIDFDLSKPFIPDFIFQFQYVLKLYLTIDQDTQIPEDWSSFSNLSRLHFQGENHIFENLNFVSTLPQLKEMDISGHYLSNPKLLFSQKKLRLSGTFQFHSMGNYSSCKKKRSFFSFRQTFLLPEKNALEIANALGRSLLTFEEKKYYLQIILKPRTLKDIMRLPVDEFIALTNDQKHNELRRVIIEQIKSVSEKQKNIETCVKENSIPSISDGSRKTHLADESSSYPKQLLCLFHISK